MQFAVEGHTCRCPMEDARGSLRMTHNDSHLQQSTCHVSKQQHTKRKGLDTSSPPPPPRFDLDLNKLTLGARGSWFINCEPKRSES